MADTGWCFVILTSFVASVVELPSPVWSKSYECPEACSCLGALVDCSKGNLVSIPNDLPAWVEILDLSSNKLVDLTPLMTQGLTKLEDLDLSNNLIEEVNHTVIAELSALRILKLKYNRLSELPVLPGATNITSLSLEHNEISLITPEALNVLPRLRQLSLGYNKLRELTADMFPLHPTLHQLYLNNNRVKRIEQGALKNLPSLTWLRLNKNKIRHLPKEVFSNLSKLQDLELSRNRLQVIEGLTFKGLTSLVTLKLDRNAITNLKDGAFYGPGNVQNLILDHNNITVVTKGWLYGLTRLEVLSLSHNRVVHVESEVWSSCELLSKLDLQYNELSVVSENTFAGLGSLQHLLVTNNHMSYIAQGAFSQLDSLQVLELDNNEISSTIEDTSATFQGLRSLKRLSLRNNYIQLITKRAFEGLEHLQYLNLANNSLTSIQMNAFSSMLNLQELFINSSSLVCDCQLAWLPHWLVQKGFQITVAAKCIHPSALQGTSVMDIPLEQFKCDDSPKPVIQIQPESQAALKGSNTSLECVAVSSDPSPLTVTWRKDNILLQNGFETYERSPSEGIVEVRSVLVFQDLDNPHGGVYQCVVSNKLGTAYSAKAEITINVLPYFIKTPEDVTSPVGTTAKLECKATGHPPPRIAWKKDGGDNFPAARERRLLMMPTDDVFFITKVNLEDEGVYSCTAENNVGTVIANATLKVLKKPVFEREMEDKVVERGSTAVLECMASGNPQPNVEWLKDDMPLEVTDRHFFTAEKRLLVIYQTEELDAGVYTCHVQNALAKEEGHSRLTITSVAIDTWDNNSPDTQVLNPEIEQSKSSGIFGDDSMMTGIIIIAVVCCVVGTSLIWVIIIYKTRKRTEEYSSTPTDETTLPGDMPSTPFHSSERDGSSPSTLAVAPGSAKFTGYNGLEANGYSGMQVNGGFRYSPAKGGRMAAIFPSDAQEDHLRQSVPLTSDEQQPAESSDTSIAMLRRLRHSTGGSESTPSSQHSSYSLQSCRSNVLQTFQPHLSASQLPCPQHSIPLPTCDQCLHGTTVAVIHAPGAAAVHYGSCPRLDTIVSEDEREPRSSGDDRDVAPGRRCDGHHGSQPPGHYSDESDYSCATFPSVHNHHTSSNHTPQAQQIASIPCSVDSHSALPQSSYNHTDSTLASSSGHRSPVSDTNCSDPHSGSPDMCVPPSSPLQPLHASTLANGHVHTARTVRLAQNHSDTCTDSESCQEDGEDTTRGHLSPVPSVSVVPSPVSAVSPDGTRDSVLPLTARDS